ncbi:M20/M25/M40 family metallo-hydrolase [Nocardioides rubriscoriae]|uniref:M20/M25/M40 family metallo-hydrolase n=1 Tax=Nocardioides rubriscoriae TaxID=642762 RepID=UPI0011E04A94|nr:M20/M25/M40 family metallo-hydrolase [Nocardioides rubriscoriae]
MSDTQPTPAQTPAQPSRRALLGTGAAAAAGLAVGAADGSRAQAAPGRPGARGADPSTEGWPDGPGRPLRPQRADAELRALLREVDPRRIQATVERLAAFGTRHTLSSQTDPQRGIGAARDWIAEQMRGYAARSGGRMTVSVPSYVQQPASRIPTPTVISNVVARLEGSTDPGRVYVVSGHYDSRATDVMDFTSDAPGADDDASGVAVAMELARIMATRRPAATIVFAAVAGEEQGLYGAAFLARQLKEEGADVQAMFTDDIVGSSRADDGEVDATSVRLFVEGLPRTEDAQRRATRLSIGGENDSPTRQLGRFVTEVATREVTGMQVRLVHRLDRYLRGGDHRAFLDAGFPAARFTEPAEDFAHQHQDVRVVDGQQYGDLPRFCDWDYIAGVARVNAATLWSLAQAPGVPLDVTIDTTDLTNNTTLTWRAGTGEAAGYEVVWRPTAEPLWQHVVPVGDVSRTTLDLSKDNVVLGVRAVGPRGHRSPAVFPFPG